MKAAAVILAAFGVVVAGAAVASDRFTDLDYLKANRCRGLAAGLAVGDTAALDAVIKSEGRSRSDPVLQRGAEELTRGKRDGGKADIKERVTAELNGPCMAYMAGGKEASSAR